MASLGIRADSSLSLSIPSNPRSKMLIRPPARVSGSDSVPVVISNITDRNVRVLTSHTIPIRKKLPITLPPIKANQNNRVTRELIPTVVGLANHIQETNTNALQGNSTSHLSSTNCSNINTRLSDISNASDTINT